MKYYKITWSFYLIFLKLAKARKMFTLKLFYTTEIKESILKGLEQNSLLYYSVTLESCCNSFQQTSRASTRECPLPDVWCGKEDVSF